MLRRIMTLVLSFLPLNFCLAEPILTSTKANSSGVAIDSGGWKAGTIASPIHADATYIAFEQVKGGPEKIDQFDFHYSLQIVPQFSNDYSNCQTTPDFIKILQGLFGTTSGALVVVKANIQYRWTTGIAVDFLKNDAGLILAAVGPSASKATPGNGCYFDTTMRPTFPLLQYGGAGKNDDFDDFVVKFTVIGGAARDIKLVSNVTSLFSEISAAAGWASIVTPLAGVASQSAQKAASSFQQSLQDAGTFQNQVSVNAKLKANGDLADRKISIRIPKLFGDSEENGNLVIYVRRSASIALANAGKKITPDTIFDNPELPNRQCNLTAIASGGCNGAGSGGAKDDGPANGLPLRASLSKLLKKIDSNLDFENPIVKLINVSNDGRKGYTYDICKGIRTVSREYLHLSVLDEMLVRWAFTKEGGLQAAIQAAGEDATKGQDLAKATGSESIQALRNMCWNKGDNDTLHAVVAKLGKTLQD